MIAERPFPAAISVMLVDGRIMHGRIATFSPYAPDITLECDDPEQSSRTKRVILRGELIAYVTFRAALSSGNNQRPTTGLTRYRVHLVSGGSVAIEAESGEMTNPLGFYGFPLASDWDVLEYFFYSHGVHRRELDAPIGQMLVDQGFANPEEIERGLVLQEAARRKSLSEILNDAKSVDDGASLQARRKQRLDDLIVEAGLVSQADAESINEQGLKRGKRFGEILVEEKIVREEDLMRTLAKKFGLAFIDLEDHPVQRNAVDLVPRGLIENLGVLPIFADSQNLILAISDPLEFQAADLLRMQVRRRVVEVLVAPTQLRTYISRVLDEPDAPSSAVPEDLSEILRGLSDEEFGADATAEERSANETTANESDTGVIRLVNRLITDGHKRGASDIHIEPNGKSKGVRVRFRVDGDCEDYAEIPSNLRYGVVARIKIMAGLDISERRKPQDGKIRFRLNDRTIELRVATLPTVEDNEDVVMRILAGSKPIPLDQMGMSERNLRDLRVAIESPYGLILCVGPTGSGKTTTLHSALGAINTPDRKIWTAEDPVEITQPGLRQVQVRPKVGYTFEIAMRAFLRADPDVIMVGEMRDMETAGTAVEASLTGHLVFSTLHTNSAPETITRLLDMGLDPFSFADALVAVLAQRLARGLCPKCKSVREATRTEFDDVSRSYGPDSLEMNLGIRSADELRVWSAPGCGACGETGYKGRVAIHELLIANDTIKRAIARRASVAEIREQALSVGMRTLVQDGIEKAISGGTDLKQVFAVCGR